MVHIESSEHNSTSMSLNWLIYLSLFLKIAVSVNETRLCAKLTVYSIANKIYIHTKITNHGEIVLTYTPILQVTFVRHTCILHSHMEKGYWDVSNYYWIFRADRWEFKWGHESRHPCEATQHHKGKTVFIKVNIESKRLSELNNKTTLLILVLS
jgi:hypothetical protein